jgi:hypothetical protein
MTPKIIRNQYIFYLTNIVNEEMKQQNQDLIGAQESLLGCGPGGLTEDCRSDEGAKDSNPAIEKLQKPDRFIGCKEIIFNAASKLVGYNAKQCCYACAGLSEKPLYTNDKKHAYSYVAICEGHVICLEKIVGCVTKKIDKINDHVSKKEDTKRRYLHKIYMTIVEFNKDSDNRQRMIQLLRKYGFFVDDDEDGEDFAKLVENNEDST